MTKVRVFQSCLRLKSVTKVAFNAGTVNNLRRQPTRQFTIGHFRSYAAVQSRNYDINQSLDGIVRSAFDDIRPLGADETIDKYVWEHMDRWPDHVAIECQLTGQKYTYSQLRTLSKRFALSLRKLGFQPGQVLSALLPNLPDYAVIVLGSLQAGVVLSPINPVYTPYEIAHQLEDNGAIGIVTLPQFFEKVEKAKKLIEAKTKATVPLRLIALKYDNSSGIPSSAIDYNEMISAKIDVSEKMGDERRVDDIALLPYSSGTTGLSKGVQLTHRNCVSNFLQIDNPHQNHYTMASGNYQEIMTGILPFYHIYGLSLVLLMSLRYGTKIVTLPKFEAASFFSLLKDHRVTLMMVVPPLVLLLGQSPLTKPEYFTKLKTMISGAGPVGVTDAERVKARMNSNLMFLQAYGLTETSPAVTISLKNESDFSTIGNLVPSTSIKIIKPDGTAASVREQGEICIKGPQVMLGYHNKPESNQQVFDEDGYFHSGDLGYYDERNRFYIVDRIKELIKVQGFQVPPTELEKILREHADVEDSAVIGVPDARTGEKPLAFVVKKRNSKVKDVELQEFVSSRVAPFKKLSGIVFVDSIPKNPSGKILRKILKDDYLSSNKY